MKKKIQEASFFLTFFFFCIRWQSVSLTWPPGSRAGGSGEGEEALEAARGAWGRRDRAVMRRRAWRGQWPGINCNLYRKWNSTTRQGRRQAVRRSWTNSTRNNYLSIASYDRRTDLLAFDCSFLILRGQTHTHTRAHMLGGRRQWRLWSFTLSHHQLRGVWIIRLRECP